VHFHWYFQWFTVLFVAATVAAGAGYRWYRHGSAAEVLPEPAEAAVGT
jgi:hypothetical protein